MWSVCNYYFIVRCYWLRFFLWRMWLCGNFPSTLRIQEVHHLGIIYSCDQCDYSSTDSASLMQHNDIKHKGVRYSCKKCKHFATIPAWLKRQDKENILESHIFAIYVIALQHQNKILRFTKKTKHNMSEWKTKFG